MTSTSVVDPTCHAGREGRAARPFKDILEGSATQMVECNRCGESTQGLVLEYHERCTSGKDSQTYSGTNLT